MLCGASEGFQSVRHPLLRFHERNFITLYGYGAKWNLLVSPVLPWLFDYFRNAFRF